MRKFMRWVMLAGLVAGLVPSLALAETVEYKGARVGFSSERDVVFDIPPSMPCEDLTRVMNSFYSRYLEPEQNRPFTLAERRLLLLCIYTNLCDISALWTGLLNIYNCDDPTRYDNCPNIDMLTGYLVDRDKLYLIRNRFAMNSYARTQAYQRYVVGMDRAIYGWWTDDATGRRVPTEVDKAIFKDVLLAAAWDNMPDFRYLEKNYNRDAIVWHRYWGVVKSDTFRATWLDLRRYYKGLVKRCESQKAVLETQCSQLFEDVATESVMRTFAREWNGQIETCTKRLHRCVYDAPYCLLVTKASSEVAFTVSDTEATSFLGTAERWLNRSDRSVQRAQEIALLVYKQMSDTEDVTVEVSTGINSSQTKRFLELLKMSMGQASYEAFREQTKLIKCLERVGSGYAL